MRPALVMCFTIDVLSAASHSLVHKATLGNPQSIHTPCLVSVFVCACVCICQVKKASIASNYIPHHLAYVCV